MLSNITKFFKDNEADVVLIVGIILISLISFGGGWLLGASSSFKTEQIGEIVIEELSPEEFQSSATKIGETETEDKIENNNLEEGSNENSGEKKEKNEQEIIASKNGSVYHYIWCPGAKQIKEENKIYFNSKQEAEKAGYRAAKNCEGL